MSLYRFIKSIIVDIDYRKPIPSKTFFESARIIPLKSIDSAMVSLADKIVIYKEHIHIYDRKQNALFVFEKNGDFLFKIDQQGRGPEEYMRLTDMKVNVQGLFLVDYTQQAMLQYDHDLKFIRKIHFDCFPFEFKFFKDKLFIYSERNNSNNDYCFYETDFQ